MAAKKRKTGGRKKGTPNRHTAGVKAALVEAFDQLGGVPSLASWARRNRADFYRLWAKLLPQEVKHEHSGPKGGPIPVDLGRLTDDQLDALDRILAAAEAAPDPGPGPGREGPPAAG